MGRGIDRIEIYDEGQVLMDLRAKKHLSNQRDQQ